MPESIWRSTAIALQAALVVIAIDFFMHAGVLARFYLERSPFLLAPAEAFNRIPFGYASFILILSYLFVMMQHLHIRDGFGGAFFGALTGAAVGLSQSLGLYSVTTAEPLLLVGWAAGYILEFGVAGYVIGLGFKGSRLGPMWLLTFLILVGAVILTIMMQNLGLAPALKLNE